MLEAFHPPRHGSVYLIGGGGKTTLMYRLGADLSERNERVLITTSTKILEPEGERLLVVPRVPDLLRELKLEEGSRVTVAKGWTAPVGAGETGPIRKLVGFSPDELDLIQEAKVSTALIVEADGSAGRSLKAHAEHEPVVSSRADLVVAVVGIDCLGRPLDEQTVHRSALFAQRLGLSPGTTILPEHVAGIILHREGYLAKVAEHSTAFVAITKVGSANEREDAFALARTIRSMDTRRRIAGVIVVHQGLNS